MGSWSERERRKRRKTYVCLQFVYRLIRCGEYSSISIGVAYIVVPHCRLVVSYDPLQLLKDIQLTPYRQRKGRREVTYSFIVRHLWL